VDPAPEARGAAEAWRYAPMTSPKLTRSYLLASLAIFVAIVVFPEEALARAGGARSKGGGILALVLWPLLAIYSAIVTYYAVLKYKQAKQLLARLATSDQVWNLDSIKGRIEQAYFSIQYAWRDRTPESAKEFMSERLYQKHKSQIADMLSRGTRNEMEDISLDSVRIVEVLDYLDDSKDSFIALIEGSMIDKLVNSAGVVIDGDNKKRPFKELWRFKREPRGWVLDEIDSSVSISDVKDLQVWSESRQ
jgi:hypothetical protein